MVIWLILHRWLNFQLTDNFWPKVTFPTRMKYRKMVFGPKPEVLPVWLRDPDESLWNQSLIILILYWSVFIKIAPPKDPPFFAWATLDMLSYTPTWPSTFNIKRQNFKSSFRWHIQNFFGSWPQRQFQCNQPINT